MDASEPAAPARKPKSLAGQRQQARHYALQALYQWQVTGQPCHEILAQFLADQDFSSTDDAFFRDAVTAVTGHTAALDARYAPFLADRTVDELGLVERAILRLGTWELLERPDVPYRVVLNEAVTLARKFGATDSHKFVNAVLDKLARETRRPEIDAG